MIRFYGANMSLALPPAGKIEPLQMCEIRGVKRDKDEASQLDLGTKGSDLMDKMQVIRKTKVVVSNQEVRFEIMENEILVPLVTESKSREIQRELTGFLIN